MTTFAQTLARITGDPQVAEAGDDTELVLELLRGRASRWAPPDGGSQPDLTRVALAARGLLAETLPLNGSGSTLDGGHLVGVLVALAEGDEAAGIVVSVLTAGEGTPPEFYAMLYDLDLNLVAVSADQGGNPTLTTVGLGLIPFTAPYIVPATAGYYVAFLQVGGFDSVLVELTAGSYSTPEADPYDGNAWVAFKQTSLSAPPDPVVPSGSFGPFWIGVAKS